MNKIKLSDKTKDLFHMFLNILNLEQKTKKPLNSSHPYIKKKMELINDVAHQGVNVGDIMDIEKMAREAWHEHQ